MKVLSQFQFCFYVTVSFVAIFDQKSRNKSEFPLEFLPIFEDWVEIATQNLVLVCLMKNVWFFALYFFFEFME